MNKKQKLIYAYLLLLPIIDVITSLMTRFSDFKLSLGMVIKGLTMIFCIIYILFFSRSKWRRKSIIYFIILGIYFILYGLFNREVWIVSNMFNELIHSFKYFYFVVIIFGIFNILDDFKFDSKYIKKVFFISSIMYTILLLIPYVTGTGFSSYNAADIGGDNGWFYAANETGAITVLLLFGITYFLNDRKKWYVFGAIPVLLSISLIGTKVSYLGMIIATVTIIIFNIIINKKKGIILSLSLLAILLVICNFSPAISNLADTNKRIEETKIKNVDKTQLDRMIPNKTIRKIVMLSLNGREDFFLNDYNLYVKSDLNNKFFGLGWSYCSNDDCDYDNELVEIDYLDIYFHYGIVGFIVYFIPLLYIFVAFLKANKSIKTYYCFIFLLLGLFISSIAGHVLSAPAVTIYLSLIIYMLVNSYTFVLNEKEVTIVSLHLGYGGIERYIADLCIMLQDDYKINIISTYKLSNKPAFAFSDKVNISYLIEGAPNKEEFKNAIREKNIKLIFKEGIKSIKLLYLKKKRNIKAIKNIHSKYIITTRDFHNNLVREYANNSIIKIATEHNYHNNNKRYYNKVISSVRGFDYFVLVSNNLKEFYKTRVNNPKCLFIPNTISELPSVWTKLNENNLISIGRLEYEKGFDDLIDVIKLVKEKVNDVRLYLIGDGSLRKELENKVLKNNLSDTIIFTGYSDRKEINDYLAKSKLYVMTSHTESFGIVLLEAMSYKVPCIAFDSADGARELLKDGVGVLIKNRDKDIMAREIIKLINDKEKLKGYQEKEYQKCKNYLTDNVKEKWLKILR